MTTDPILSAEKTDISDLWREATDGDENSFCEALFTFEEVPVCYNVGTGHGEYREAVDYANDYTLVGILVNGETYHGRAWAINVFGYQTVTELEEIENGRTR